MYDGDTYKINEYGQPVRPGEQRFYVHYNHPSIRMVKNRVLHSFRRCSESVSCHTHRRHTTEEETPSEPPMNTGTSIDTTISSIDKNKKE